MTEIRELLDRAISGSYLTREEAITLYEQATDGELMEAGHAVRMRLHPQKEVTWIIDRNVNITNVCLSFCTFCNFCRREQDEDAYITTTDQYRDKIQELYTLGGNQLLLQGGMHPKLGLDFYVNLFKELKREFPDLKLHALGPPEVVHLARMEKSTTREILNELVQAGLDSLPGAGAEILVERVRREVSRAKCTAREWLDVMRVAHQLNLPTSATMMFGHAEKPEDRIDHMLAIRAVQNEKPADHDGFVNFVSWPFMDEGTVLREKKGIVNQVDSRSYIRTLALSRLLLPNIPHIQASWLTVGVVTGQICLHAGADDFGSIMIEEHVVSAAGAHYQMDAEGMQAAIREAGFTPRLRDQRFRIRET